MTTDINVDSERFLERIVAEASAEGKPLSDLEKRCMSAVLQGKAHLPDFVELKREFPSSAAFDEFSGRTVRLVERVLLHQAETQPQVASHARAMMTQFLAGRGEVVVESAISTVLFGRLPPGVRVSGIAAVVLLLALVNGWRLCVYLVRGTMSGANRFLAAAALALVAAVAVKSAKKLFQKVGEK